MIAAVRGPRSGSTWLTGTAGLLVLTLALVMMIFAAPSGARAQDHGRPAAPHTAPLRPGLLPAATLSVTARQVPGPPATRHDQILHDLGLQ